LKRALTFDGSDAELRMDSLSPLRHVIPALSGTCRNEALLTETISQFGTFLRSLCKKCITGSSLQRTNTSPECHLAIRMLQRDSDVGWDESLVLRKFVEMIGQNPEQFIEFNSDALDSIRSSAPETSRLHAMGPFGALRALVTAALNEWKHRK
jgi:hypothetical protein